MTTNSIASYLRIGETFDRPEAPTELAPGEMGTTGGAVARYLKIERHERPVAKKTATAPKKQSRAPKRTRPAKQEPVAVVLELDAADLPQPAERHEVEDTFTELRGQQHANPKAAKATRPKQREQRTAKPRMIQCPDCEAKIPAGTDQCPSCALFLDKAA